GSTGLGGRWLMPAFTRLLWVAAERDFVPADEPDGITVMDSWLVENGRMRALSAHIRRFRTACTRMAVPGEQSTEFVHASVRRIPASGRWFPRVELVLTQGTPQFQLWIRPAPPRGDTVRLWISTEPDQRVHPSVKGADLDYLVALRRSAAAAGADEALILSPDGRVREGASTSVLWWRDDVLCAPPETSAVLPGVTRAVLLGLAAERGIRVEIEEPKPHDLAGLEVWAVNALHGIRSVRGWAGTPIDAGPAYRARRWNSRLDRLAVPVISDRIETA
ncbi:MAG TPA: aminotransferase class IV, partial [Pseudonocardiaceae bacterium]|nr:aminotransferase class IV [Pseudonocardiaceae bacterium]